MSQIYPQWWNQTITIYNKYKDPLTDMITWYRHVLNGAFWKYSSEKVSINNTTLTSNQIVCRIRKDASFLENYEWVDLPADIKPDYFTLNKDDIIVRGEVDTEINEYEAGHRSSDVIEKYKNLQGCLVIADFTINVGGGRYTEHYLARGD